MPSTCAQRVHQGGQAALLVQVEAVVGQVLRNQDQLLDPLSGQVLRPA